MTVSNRALRADADCADLFLPSCCDMLLRARSDMRLGLPVIRAGLNGAAMGEGGVGVLLYPKQEGREIGLTNKMQAHGLQERGLDMVEANHHLGFEDDERDFRIGAALLARLGISEVRLMTNNPAKVAMLTAQGVRVAARVPLAVGRTAQNARYLAVKAQKSGHLLP